MHPLFVALTFTFVLATGISGWTCPSDGSYNAVVSIIGKTDSSFDYESLFDDFDNGTSCGHAVATIDSTGLQRIMMLRVYHPESDTEMEELVDLYDNWPEIRSFVSGYMLDHATDNETFIFSGSVVVPYNDSLLTESSTYSRIGPTNVTSNITRRLPVSINTDFNLDSSVYTGVIPANPPIIAISIGSVIKIFLSQCTCTVYTHCLTDILYLYMLL